MRIFSLSLGLTARTLGSAVIGTAIVGSITLGGSLLAATPGMAQQQDLVKYCKADIQRLCKNVPPGDGRIIACLKSHSKEMSVGCAQALQKMKQG